VTEQKSAYEKVRKQAKTRQTERTTPELFQRREQVVQGENRFSLVMQQRAPWIWPTSYTAQMSGCRKAAAAFCRASAKDGLPCVDSKVGM
jgi:hypothetical protein